MNTLVPVSRVSCPMCRAQKTEVIEYSDTVDFRGLELDVEKLQETRCGNCGHKWVTKAQHAHNSAVMREAYGAQRDKIREAEGLLGGHEIAQLREKFRLNQREAAALFGGGFNAFNKYESGEVLQSYAMDRLLRLTEAVGMPALEFLKDVFSPPNFIMITTTIPNEVRISIGWGFGLFNRIPNSGTSESLNSVQLLGNLVNQKNLPVAHERYSVITK